MPPRRSHKKSRAGCRKCKARKIKCDEVHPRCGNCTKHGILCDFGHPEGADDSLSATPASQAASPSSSAFEFASPFPSKATPAAPVARLYRPPSMPALSPTTPVASRLLELKLLHQYTTMTSSTLAFCDPGTHNVWRDAVPHIAFDHSHHLTDAVLAVAALHLRSLNPNDQEMIRASHAYMASSLREYSEMLSRGINASNAESLFLTATLITFQSSATRIFIKDELNTHSAFGASNENRVIPGGYALPLSWFHAFQGVKTVTTASWPFLRRSGAVIPIIKSQPVLQLDFNEENSHFGHLLDGLEDELKEGRFADKNQQDPEHEALVDNTRRAYEHAVAVLNWAHKIPQQGAALLLPSTVSRRFVELLEGRHPRALAILACFFALLKCFDGIWWLQGTSRREVLGIVSLFNSEYFGPEIERKWWPHLEWAVRIALYDNSTNPGYVPPEVWGGAWLDEATVLAQRGEETFVSHLEQLAPTHAAQQHVHAVRNENMCVGTPKQQGPIYQHQQPQKTTSERRSSTKYQPILPAIKISPPVVEPSQRSVNLTQIGESGQGSHSPQKPSENPVAAFEAELGYEAVSLD